MRLLRPYFVSCARQEHHCDKCWSPIMPGESYRAEVFSVRRRIWVYKEHEICPPDSFRDYAEEVEAELMEGLERDEAGEEGFELPEAA